MLQQDGGMTKVVDKLRVSLAPNPVDAYAELVHTWEHLSRQLRGHRVEIVNERIVISPVPGPKHNQIFALLYALLAPLAAQRGWWLWPDISLFLGPQKDRYRPDLTVVPADPPLWGDNEVHGDGVLLAVEIVSPSSHHDDHNVKPLHLAAYGVPLYLVIDIIHGAARLMSDPSEQGYRTETKVPLGEPLALPEPFGVTLETGRLLDSAPPSPSAPATPGTPASSTESAEPGSTAPEPSAPTTSSAPAGAPTTGE
jgi:Uma2 family endonuclease